MVLEFCFKIYEKNKGYRDKWFYRTVVIRQRALTIYSTFLLTETNLKKNITSLQCCRFFHHNRMYKKRKNIYKKNDNLTFHILICSWVVGIFNQIPIFSAKMRILNFFSCNCLQIVWNVTIPNTEVQGTIEI